MLSFDPTQVRMGDTKQMAIQFTFWSWTCAAVLKATIKEGPDEGSERS